MAKTSAVAFGICALLAVAVPARAQEPDAPSRFLNPRELALYVTSGGDTTGIGVTVRWPMTSRLSIQAEGEYRNEQRDVAWYLPSSRGINANLVVVLDLPRVWRVTPFVVGGGGLEHHLDLDSSRPSSGPLWRTGDSFVVNGGGGVRVALSDRVGVRVEVRYADGWAQGARDSVRFMYGTTVGFGDR
jgi:opacity protein-like surface antigen